MKFKDFKLTDDNHFIGMQYYGLILNRTFMVLLVDDQFIAIKVNGIIAAETRDLNARLVMNSLIIKGDLHSAYSYIKPKYINSLMDCELLDGSILQHNKANFILKRSAIKDAYHKPRKKWGMGTYPHDGSVYVKTEDATREFIILGNQSGSSIVERILRARY